jgi:O-methyltransferase involved in polyketide biosynthesis
LLVDVLQYVQPEEQAALLARCAAALEPGGRLIARVHDVGRGLRARITTAFDSLVFRSAGSTRRPAHLRVAEYRRMLTDAGLVVSERRMKNKLPLVHVVLTARKPEAGA